MGAQPCYQHQLFHTQELTGKNNEIIEEVGKAKLELNQRIQRLETERHSKQDLYDKIDKLEKDLAGK